MSSRRKIVLELVQILQQENVASNFCPVSQVCNIFCTTTSPQSVICLASYFERAVEFAASEEELVSSAEMRANESI